MSDEKSDDLRRLPLHDLHEQAGARFAPFAGYQMPVRFGSILEEHAVVREKAGLFDVSHMGEVFLRGEGARAATQRLVTNDVGRLTVGKAIYAAMCKPDGGIVDDLIVYQTDTDEFLLCVNAARREEDLAWIQGVVGDDAEIVDESDDWCQFAVQGPLARDIVNQCSGADLMEVPRFSFAKTSIAGHEIIAARTGYTGEDGFELFVRNDGAKAVYEALFDVGGPRGLEPIGLGARDTLRLEAGLLLYGVDIDETVSPLEAGISFAVKLDSDDFMGRDALIKQRDEGVPRKLVGLQVVDRGAVRGGEAVVVDDEEVGTVTSASVAPSLEKAMIAHALVSRDAAEREELAIKTRRKSLRAKVVKRPFYRRAS